MDREARDPLELLDEISDQLQLECAPMVWPVGMGLNFRGTVDLYTEEFSPSPAARRSPAARSPHCSRRKTRTSSTRMWNWSAPGCRASTTATYTEGHQTPVYFGSALKNFGVRDLLSALAKNAPPPGPRRHARPHRRADRQRSHRLRVQGPGPTWTPNHRDRVAFPAPRLGPFPPRDEAHAGPARRRPSASTTRSCFSRRSARRWTRRSPATSFGIPNHGTLRVGDTLSESGE